MKVFMSLVMILSTQLAQANYCWDNQDCGEGSYCHRMPTIDGNGLCRQVFQPKPEKLQELNCHYKDGSLALASNVNRNTMTKACLDRGECPVKGVFYANREQNSAAFELVCTTTP